MRHMLFGDADSHPIALLLKASAFNRQEVLQHYVAPLTALGIDQEALIALSLAYNEQGKAPAGFIKETLAHVLPALESVGVTTLYVADANYFKVLTRQPKAEPHLGYVLPCKLKDYEHFKVILGVNHKALLYNPEQQHKLDLSLKTLVGHVQGSQQRLGEGIIHHAEYPKTLSQIEAALRKLHQYSELTCDIEAFSLRFEEAGIATIGFAWNQHEGLAFACDYEAHSYSRSTDQIHGYQVANPQVRALIREFLESYQGTLIWHGSTYDLRVLIYTLWMQDPLDTAGLLKGLEVMTARFHDTKTIAYLALNSTVRNEYGLKALAHEFAGNYAQEGISDVRRIPLSELLQYNLVDCLSTRYVFDKYYPKMVADNQLALYEGLFRASLKTIIQMELTGMPLDPERVQAVKAELTAIRDKHLQTLETSKIIQMLNLLVQDKAWEADYQSRKSKAKNPHKIQAKDPGAFAHLKFNPNSGPQLQQLLYTQMGLPVLDTTKTGQPATGADTLEKLLNHTQVPEYRAIIEALIGYAGAEKILSTFIPAFERALKKADGRIYLHGSFNLGGTVSGRLSSSEPNLQNLPAGSEYGKLIKSCFQAPQGWIMCGADFNALEDRINALLTRDPNKIKVFTDGFDSHCLRTYYYWPELFPNLKETPEDINSIKKTHDKERGKSKTPSFALQYLGTWMTLVKNSGFAEDEAKKIEERFHGLYAVSRQWVLDRIDEAARKGYAEAAFGLRIRTPLLRQTLLGHRTTPREAEAEARTLGNAISGQSYGLLNNRAANAFMEKVWASPYREQIKPIALIHDAVYLLIKDDIEVVEWVNTHLIQEMEWQDLPEIQHPEVKLGAELDLFFPDWSQPITLPNHIDQCEISLRVAAELTKRKEKEAA